ncbi:MAG: ferredoxin III, nif-specific [Rhodospirillaceae bacterium]|nr:ferredoxin III, nif-specific [Rhodospirillaceae bacterium]
MSYQALTRGGMPWQPSYIEAISVENCIGCGRCYKVCGFSVLELKAATEDGEIVDLDTDEEIEKRVMTIANGDNCVGCMACSRVCGAKAQTHAPVEVMAS